MVRCGGLSKEKWSGVVEMPELISGPSLSLMESVCRYVRRINRLYAESSYWHLISSDHCTSSSTLLCGVSEGLSSAVLSIRPDMFWGEKNKNQPKMLWCSVYHSYLYTY